MGYDVIGIGNALVDIQIEVSDEFLKRLNLTKGGMTLSANDEQKRLLSSLKGHSLTLCSGGSAANTIHGIGSLGGDVYYFGKVGNDKYGHHYADDMAKCCVGFTAPKAKSTGTGTSVVLITPDAQRTMITELGISAELNQEDINENIVKEAKFVYIEGYLWCNDTTRIAAVRLAEIAKKNSVPIAFTLSDSFVVNSFHDAILDFIRQYVNILFCNKIEGISMAKENNPEKAFEYINGIVDTLFFTLGDKGVFAGDRNNKTISLNGYNVNAVDTTGAGDLFAAGALYGLINEKTMRECCILGCYCASQVITHFGARLPHDSRKNIDEIICDYDKGSVHK